jgi:hypothetical protein
MDVKPYQASFKILKLISKIMFLKNKISIVFIITAKSVSDQSTGKNIRRNLAEK